MDKHPGERMKSKVFDKSLAGIYEALGGISAFRRVSRRFHRKIEGDPALRGFFPRDMEVLEERLALFLGELTGGGPFYTASRGKTSLFCRHSHLPIGTQEAERWLAHMSSAIQEEGIDDSTRTQLLTNLTELASTLADPFVLLYRLPIAELRLKLEENPSLASDCHRGRNLLCAAAINWDLERIRLLLEFGADADVRDAGGHNALYRAANGGGREDDGRAVINLLTQHGADVNQVTGVGGMTPLHMAARRGTTKIANALLDAGADIEAKDKNGETPLRRAVNCGQGRMVRLLLSRGANPRSTDRRGLTPIEAARTENMRMVLRGEDPFGEGPSQ